MRISVCRIRRRCKRARACRRRGEQARGAQSGSAHRRRNLCRSWGASIASSGEGVSSALRRSDSDRRRGRRRGPGPARTSCPRGAVIRPTFYTDPPALRRRSSTSSEAPSATPRARSRRRPGGRMRATGSSSRPGARSEAPRRSRRRRRRSRRSSPTRPTGASGRSRSLAARRRSRPRTARRTTPTRATRAPFRR